MPMKSMTNEEINKHIFRVMDNICWKCGGKGFWFEQIDGPNNLRRVECTGMKCIARRAEAK